ncbi:hypothetical protein MLD38_031826 [Melastoma candidum]|uniref:Uncharacterized protein n=1 Tax=Melastoma candidum TaxID=119954 RepID=A0ACB9MQW3_9MYRT|nr:hypothetical protein MLD38_031826 [Melastoma candidum]
MAQNNSYYNRNQIPVAYPPPSTAQVQYVAPPPAGYPMRDSQQQPPVAAMAVETKSRGDGFWKGCCAALCCCCVLETCF